MNDTEIEPALAEAPPCWPPLAHIIPKNEPVREGMLALCGAKLMGMDIGYLLQKANVCEKCVQVMRRLLPG